MALKYLLNNLITSILPVSQTNDQQDGYCESGFMSVSNQFHGSQYLQLQEINTSSGSEHCSSCYNNYQLCD